jgi:hypothetical protein
MRVGSGKSIDGVDMDHLVVSRKSFAGRERSVTNGELRRKKDAMRLSIINQQLCKMFGEDNGGQGNNVSSPKAIGKILSGVISPSQGGETSLSATTNDDGATPPRLSEPPRQQVPANVAFALLDKNRVTLTLTLTLNLALNLTLLAPTLTLGGEHGSASHIAVSIVRPLKRGAQKVVVASVPTFVRRISDGTFTWRRAQKR